MRQKIKINFTDFWPIARDIKRNPIYYILSKKFDLELSDDPDFLIYSCFGTDFLKYNCVRIFYTGENVRPDFEACDYAFSFDYPVTDRNFRFPVYAWHPGVEKLIAEPDVENIFRKKTKFCNFVYSNKRAKERIRFFKQLSRYKPVDSGGKILNNIRYRVDNKIEFLKSYKFTIAFENESYPGYTTEKIWEAKIAGTVPIYWGNPLVYRDFNPKSFINCHEYNNFDEVVERVAELDRDDALYQQYLAQPFFHHNVPNKFMDRAKIWARFAHIFNSKIEPVARTRPRYWLNFKYGPKRLKFAAIPLWKKLRTSKQSL